MLRSLLRIIVLGPALLAAAACASPTDDVGSQSGAASTSSPEDCAEALRSVTQLSHSTETCIEAQGNYPRDLAVYRALGALAGSCPAEVASFARGLPSSVYGVRLLAGTEADLAGVSFYASADGNAERDEPFGTIAMTFAAKGQLRLVLSVSGADPEGSGTYQVTQEGGSTWVTIPSGAIRTADETLDVAGRYRLVARTRDGLTDHRLEREDGKLVFRTFWHAGCDGI